MRFLIKQAHMIAFYFQYKVFIFILFIRQFSFYTISFITILEITNVIHKEILLGKLTVFL